MKRLAQSHTARTLMPAPGFTSHALALFSFGFPDGHQLGSHGSLRPQERPCPHLRSVECSCPSWSLATVHTICSPSIFQESVCCWLCLSRLTPHPPRNPRPTRNLCPVTRPSHPGHVSLGRPGCLPAPCVQAPSLMGLCQETLSFPVCLMPSRHCLVFGELLHLTD